MEDEAIGAVAKQRLDLLETGVPTVVIVALVLVAWAAWVVTHRIKGKVPEGGARLVFFVVRVVVGAVALWSLWQLAGRFLVLASSWPLWVNAFIGGATAEAAMAAYGYERATLSKRRSNALLGLRMAAIALVLFILVQPVFSRLIERQVDREVVVLIDDSESMQLVDGQLPAGDKMALARFYGVDGLGDGADLRGELEALKQTVRGLQRQSGALGIAAGGAALPDGVRDGVVTALGEAGDVVEAKVAFWDGVRSRGGLPGEAANVVGAAARSLREAVLQPVRKAAGAVAEGKVEVAQGALKEAVGGLGGVVERLPIAIGEIEAQQYGELAGGVRETVDEVTRRSRAAIARDVMTREAGEEGSLVDLLEERYRVRYVRFGKDAAELSAAQYLEAPMEAGGIDLGTAVFEGGLFVGAETTWRVVAPKRNGLEDGWAGIDFQDNRWRRVSGGGVGYTDDREGRKKLRTKLDGVMRNKSSTLCMRAVFEVANPEGFGDLMLGATYDDGFVAYLNGREIARRNVGDGELRWDSKAQSDRVPEEVARRERIRVADGASQLVEGKNVLAVLGVNVDRRDNDFFADFSLSGELAKAEEEPAPGEPAEDGEGSDDADGAAEGLDFRAITDVTGALEHAAEKIAPETLAGVLLLSDGQHNARGLVEDVARRLGVQGAPVGAVAIGSPVGPPDASVLDLQVGESVYLGDKIVARADVKLDGLRGQTVRAVLLRDGEELDELEVRVPEERYRTTLRFKHVPEDKGIYSYSVRIDPVEGELFQDNNAWHFDVAVTDDRKNVLLVDSFPRWEFRYLRNLFFARDKSVHLQYVLLHQEMIEGQEPLPDVAASASRPFGEAEATRLPENRDEWLKFDAIIIGDVPPGVLGEAEWEIIEECVRERGAMLTVIAGPRYMPHAFTDERFKELMPVLYEESEDDQFQAPELVFRLALTPEGRNSAVMRQAPSGVVNGQIWGGMPDLGWRTRVSGAKEGAEVLAYAEVEGEELRRSGSEGLQGLFEEREAQRAKALITTQRYAMGSVCALMFDQTWRFRYGVGDVYHHRFWGQLMRWGTGENLRVGTEFVRMGSDQLSYEPGEKVKVMARVSTSDYRPVVDDEVRVSVYRGDERLLGTKLRYREGSNGVYETELEPFDTPGRYRLVLEGDQAEDILAEDSVEELATEFLVETAKNALELSELTVDRDFLNKTAALSDGRVVGPGGAATLIDLFGEPSRVVEERLETTLWDTWPVLLLFVGVVTAEWIVRRRGGLV